VEWVVVVVVIYQIFEVLIFFLFWDGKNGEWSWKKH
jgi:hypothetical protein